MTANEIMREALERIAQGPHTESCEDRMADGWPCMCHHHIAADALARADAAKRCVCEPGSWHIDPYPICNEFVSWAGDGGCRECSHERGCHNNTEPEEGHQ